jgi:hypothetical protein
MCLADHRKCWKPGDEQHIPLNIPFYSSLQLQSTFIISFIPKKIPLTRTKHDRTFYTSCQHSTPSADVQRFLLQAAATNLQVIPHNIHGLSALVNFYFNHHDETILLCQRLPFSIRRWLAFQLQR